ncbi:hypothetical protein Tsubulata_015131 [Turnera subulata]|uniref:Serine aminopeptidase S33 domain-containing protein n=1 Tax=Turnera subulata TaxID=218843 RepID=A0A9Q0J0G1_9ROSI|nr:hypothetical protein Tsubulata_015131 [Turnera subulata]
MPAITGAGLLAAGPAPAMIRSCTTSCSLSSDHRLKLLHQVPHPTTRRFAAAANEQRKTAAWKRRATETVERSSFVENARPVVSKEQAGGAVEEEKKTKKEEEKNPYALELERNGSMSRSGGGKRLKDYFEEAKDVIRPDGGPPRWARTDYAAPYSWKKSQLQPFVPFLEFIPNQLQLTLPYILSLMTVERISYLQVKRKVEDFAVHYTNVMCACSRKVEDGIDLANVIKGAAFYRRGKSHDYVLDYVRVTPSEYRKYYDERKSDLQSRGTVMLSTLADGKIVKGLAGIPLEGPVLFVGYHMLLGWDVAPLAFRFLEERNILLRGLAHPTLFSRYKQGLLPPLSEFDAYRVMGSVPVSATNFYKLLSSKSHVLLYPGGMREACHRRGEQYKLIWPEHSEFVRMAARFGAKIVPFGSVGEDDFGEVVFDYDDQLKIPFIRDFNRELTAEGPRLRHGEISEVGNQDTHMVGYLPKYPGGRKQELKDRNKAHELYLHIKSEVEAGIAFLKEKRESDPYRNSLARLAYQATHGFTSETSTMATAGCCSSTASFSLVVRCSETTPPAGGSSLSFSANKLIGANRPPRPPRRLVVSTEQQQVLTATTSLEEDDSFKRRREEAEPREEEEEEEEELEAAVIVEEKQKNPYALALVEGGEGEEGENGNYKSLKDYFEETKDLIRSDGGPPRWFSPLECGSRLENSPLLLFLPGLVDLVERTSQLPALIPLLELIPGQIQITVPYLLSLMTGDPLRLAMDYALKGIPLQQTVQELSQDVAAMSSYLDVLADILPRETLLWKLQMLKSASRFVNSRLHAIKAQTLILTSGRDQLLPSEEEGQRLFTAIPRCDTRKFKESGHFLLLEDGVDLSTIIKGATFFRRGKYHDYISDYFPPTPSEFKKLYESNRLFLQATSPVMLSTLEDGKVVKGLAGVPSQGPVLFVGYHMLLGFELIPIVSQLLLEKNILLRGLAHPVLFIRLKKEGPLPPLSDFDMYRQMGAAPVSATNFYKLLSSKAHVLLYPGGMREASHRKGEQYKLFWPEQSEFVRMAARFGATIVPFGAVGEDDFGEEKREHDPYRNLMARLAYQAIHGFDCEIRRGRIEEFHDDQHGCHRWRLPVSSTVEKTANFAAKGGLESEKKRETRETKTVAVQVEEEEEKVLNSYALALEEGVGGIEGECGKKGLKDYFEESKDLIRSDGGPPRWFSPLECGSRLDNSPLLLFLPGLVELVERTVRSENHNSPNRPIYLVGESLGACLALAVAARNPNEHLSRSRSCSHLYLCCKSCLTNYSLSCHICLA